MDIKEIKNLIKFVAKSKVSEVRLELREFKITIKTDLKKSSPKNSSTADSLSSKDPIVVSEEKKLDDKLLQTNISEELTDSDDKSYEIIKSPIIGTFYRKPSPDKPAFVDVGSEVKEGDVLCVIEAMKLFNEIESEIQGKIVKILVEDSSPVEFDQPLFLVDPS